MYTSDNTELNANACVSNAFYYANHILISVGLDTKACVSNAL